MQDLSKNLENLLGNFLGISLSTWLILQSGVRGYLMGCLIPGCDGDLGLEWLGFVSQRAVAAAFCLGCNASVKSHMCIQKANLRRL